MKPNLLRSTASMILGWIAVTTPMLARDRITDLHLTVRIYDYAGLSPESRGELAQNTTRILGQARIAVSLITCYTPGVDASDPVCNSELRPTDLMLRIFEPNLAMKGKQLGYAAMTPGSGAYITIFVDPTRRKARIAALSDGALLGHAVAHEIGHLLLGAGSHSSSGIMRPVWRPCDEEWMAKGALYFDGGQAKRMQASLAARGSGERPPA